MMERVEQITAIDAQIFETMGIELEKRAERYALCASRASFGHPAPEGAEGVERDGGHVRPLARKRISHKSSPFVRLAEGDRPVAVAVRSDSRRGYPSPMLMR